MTKTGVQSNMCGLFQDTVLELVWKEGGKLKIKKLDKITGRDSNRAHSLVTA
jgi:hypothetical protein